MTIPIESVNTKLEAYKLIHDSTRLFSLLYSKYGDIEDDYFISFINQLIFNVPTKYNRLYKESIYENNNQEFIRRLYKKYETKERIPKLSDYYKNYLKFFCRPFFKKISLAKIVHNFQDKQAEIFYKQNYNDFLDYEKEKEKEKKDNSYQKSSEELSSLDNITNNKIIFDERTKKLIDNGLKNEMCTLTLESSQMNNINDNKNINNYNYEGELISKRSKANNSFEKAVHYLVHSQLKKKIENKKKNVQSMSKKKLINSPSAHPPYLAKIIKNNNYSNINSLNREIIPKNNKIKNSLFTLAKKNFIRTGGIRNIHNNKGFLSPKIIKNNQNMNSNNMIHSKVENTKNNKPNSHMNSFQFFTKNSNINYLNNNFKNNKKKSNKVKKSNIFNPNTIYKNFSILSEALNKYKQCNYKGSNVKTSTNKNNFNKSNSKKVNYANSSNILTKSNNKIDDLKIKQNNLNIQKNIHLNVQMNKLPFHHNKNQTFDFNILKKNVNKSKFNSNNDFHNIRAFYEKSKQMKKKISSKFNINKKPITEVVSHYVSPSHKKIDNNEIKEKSISYHKDRTKKIFLGLYQPNKSNNKKTNKFDSPKIISVSRKSKTFNTEENYLYFEGVVKNGNNGYKNNINNNMKNKENIYNWKIKTTCILPLSNYNSNYNKLVKKNICGNINDKLKNDKKDILEIMDDKLIFSRNKKKNKSKISLTKSQNEVNLNDICIKSIKNLKSNSIRKKKNLANKTYLEQKKNNNNINYNIINSSSDLQNIRGNNILSKLILKKLSFKRKTKKLSQRVSLKNIKKKIYRKQKSNTNKINVIFNGDVIINKNELIEIKQNNININNRSNKNINKNQNNIFSLNSTNKDRGNSFNIINVNRNINLINKKDQNIKI